jgi:hypothetical protein
MCISAGSWILPDSRYFTRSCSATSTIARAVAASGCNAKNSESADDIPEPLMPRS